MKNVAQRGLGSRPANKTAHTLGIKISPDSMLTSVLCWAALPVVPPGPNGNKLLVGGFKFKRTSPRLTLQ